VESPIFTFDKALGSLSAGRAKKLSRMSKSSGRGSVVSPPSIEIMQGKQVAIGGN
jgi:hypothetical protein